MENKLPFYDYVNKTSYYVAKGTLFGALSGFLLFNKISTGVLIGASVGAGFGHSELIRSLKTYGIIKDSSL